MNQIKKKEFEYQVLQEFLPQVGEVQNLLKTYITPERLNRFDNVLSKRSRRILTVFEDTHHCHNISAILRTQDALGFHDVLFQYDTTPTYKNFRAKDSVERGSSTWLNAKHSPSIEACAHYLKERGYAIGLVSLPSFAITGDKYKQELPAFSPEDFQSEPFKEWLDDRPIALVFGAEKRGISEQWKDFADFYAYVPMYGFVESFNVSVCAAMLLNSFRLNLERLYKTPYLTEAEHQLILETWVSRRCKNAETMLKKLHPELLPYFRYSRGADYWFDLNRS